MRRESQDASRASVYVEEVFLYSAERLSLTALNFTAEYDIIKKGERSELHSP